MNYITGCYPGMDPLKVGDYMSRGNADLYKSSPITGNIEIDREENALLVKHCLDVYHMKEPDLSSPEETQKAIDYYFESCLSKGLRPGNMGLYAALGLDRREALNLIQGRIKKNVSPLSLAHIKKACKAISLYRELLGSQGKLNPATLIFWQKNFDGLEDVQKLDVAAINTPEPEMSTDEIRKQIENDIPIDTEYREIE